MPSDAENTMFLYLVLTHENKPVVSLHLFPPECYLVLTFGQQIDWNAVGTAMNLNKGAVSKRWSRLKQAMDKGGDPSGSTYEFLWLCVKHSNRAGVSSSIPHSHMLDGAFTELSTVCNLPRHWQR